MPTAPGYADVSLKFTQTGLIRPAFVTFGIDPTGTDPAIMATSVQASWNDGGSLKSVTDNSCTLVGVRVSYGTDGSADLVYDLTTSDTGGAVGAATLPGNCAVLCRKVTARGGRRGRGRFYLPWVAQETVVDEAGIITPANVTTIQTACNNFMTSLTTRGVPMYLLHEEGRTAIPPPDLVTQLVVDRLIGTQRRRLGR